MAAASQKSVTVGDACPDPSAHGSTNPRLQDSASKAALLATQSDSNRSSSTSPQNTNPLGPDGKLSSASAATSLKHAKPHELPSFPSVGIDTQNSGGKAASLATNNQKPFEHWKPELSSSASKAALKASQDGGKLNLWQPTASEHGMSAAGTALGKQKGLSPQLDYGYTAQGTSNALKAATISVNSGHKRSTSTEPAPLPQYPDAANSTSNALNAASVAHTPSTKKKVQPQPLGDSDRLGSAAMEAARVQHLQASPAMYGEHPPVNIEVEEKRHQDALRASAVSFAKQMYEVQQQKSEASALSAAAAARKSDRSLDNDELRQQAVNYINLQEEAQRLANERLAKLDPDGVFAYRQHYGYGEESKRNRLSIRGSRKARSSTEEADSSEDEARAGRVRRQQTKLQADIASVDEKRTKDRADLLATAQKLVQQRMSTMDEKVFQETGKASPAMMEEWEAKAKAKAAADSETRMVNHGKVHIGGGKYMDQSEIDAIAAGRMQPTLDEIADTAEKQRIRDEEIRLDQERRKAEEEREKQREKENKAELQRQKNEEKQRINDEKAKAKAEKNEEKAKIKAEKDAEKQAEKQRKAEEKEQKQQAKNEAKQAEEERKRQKKAEAEAAKQREAAEKAEADAERDRIAAEAQSRAEQDRILKEADERAAKHAGGAALVGAGAGAVAGAGAFETAETSAVPIAETSNAAPAADTDAIDRTHPEPAKAEPIVEDPAPLQGSRIEPGDPIVDPDAEPVKETEREVAAHPEAKPKEDDSPVSAVDPEPETKPFEPEPAPVVTSSNKESVEESSSVGRPSVEKSDRNRLHKSKPSASSGEHVADRALPLEREWQANRLSLEHEKNGPDAGTTAGAATGTEYTDVFKNDPTGPASSALAEKNSNTKDQQQPKKRGFFNKLVKRSRKSSEETGKESAAATQAEPVSEASKGKQRADEGTDAPAERAEPSTEVERGRTSEVSNDNFEEARDKFDDEQDETKLSVAPIRASLISARTDGSPARSTSRFQEEL